MLKVIVFKAYRFRLLLKVRLLYEKKLDIFSNERIDFGR